MPDIRPATSVSSRLRHDGPMQDWKRLGDYVVARRVKLGHGQRQTFADAAQINVRVLSDIENGRRGNFDKVTIARLEAALGWETGSVMRVVEGGEPWLTEQAPSEAASESLDRLLIIKRPEQEEALKRVLRSDLPDAKKRQIIQVLIAERDAAERRRAEHAEELIRLVRDEDPPQ